MPKLITAIPISIDKLPIKSVKKVELLETNKNRRDVKSETAVVTGSQL